MLVRSRAPFRISFGGGGSDVPPYCWENGGAVLNVTVNRYAYASLALGGEKIIISSVDMNRELVYSVSRLPYDGQLDLIKAVANQFKLDKGFKVETFSEIQAGSGMGTSSSLAVSLISAFSEALGLRMKKYDIAMLAYNVERVELGQLGGYQDQFAAAYGGLNLMEFFKEGVKVTPLVLKDEVFEELQYRTLLLFTGKAHFSHEIHADMKKKYEEEKEKEKRIRDELKRIAYELYRALQNEDLDYFGQLINENWEFKKKMSEKISDQDIDRAYDALIKAGGRGGKIQGAGGGGFILMFTKKDKRGEVIKEALKMNLEPLSFRFEKEGVKVWKI